ncbi:hypothetical protein CYMTET_31617 [Cymbomonas tetramitiformis]|uniref:Protein kinase domain-containing protein n=1 Tax=Cymbomonas tetramitiformis TaxID=36881 RepID=A0AAE0KSQ1_9CHLO|nr:hypothetical protein CYMTET_31617 [Cymbomonas tetramitiformis]
MTMDVLTLNPEWKHVKSLGKGNMAAVHLFDHLPTERQWAVKFVERGHLIDDSFRKEMINHRSLQHKNIIQFHEVLLTPGYLAIVMEYASGGDLFHYVKEFGPVTESTSRGIMQQLISGVDYAHNQGICHRDLKLENTLLEETADGLDVPVVKICDFGFAKNAKWQSKPKSKVGTPAYCAPEVFMNTSQDYDGKVSPFPFNRIHELHGCSKPRSVRWRLP